MQKKILILITIMQEKKTYSHYHNKKLLLLLSLPQYHNKYSHNIFSLP